MTRDHLPCGRCARFISAKAGPGHCEGFDRPALSTDQPCVLFNEQGAWETRQGQMQSKAGQRQGQAFTAKRAVQPGQEQA